ncbi:hypothetical protein BHE74_00034415 [Ensete ventricosum]|nr:hypothetical protein GW17_00058539 [Ensete ventricosum]RWW58687.1 hypothetical protein BHE74_00034415 [Ensete ventricosum]RZR82270.1 hypothetical protein BHM03_00008641 [Ensete ventricosum]
MIEPIEESDHEEEDIKYEEEDRGGTTTTDCMVQALAGYANLQMMKIRGFLKQQLITVLIDTGSINNFMNNKVDA